MVNNYATAQQKKLGKLAFTAIIADIRCFFSAANNNTCRGALEG